MKRILTIFKKELMFYFNNPIGYIVAILFAVFANFLFMKDIFLRGNTSMRPFFDAMPWLLLIFVPALTMRVFAEEKRTHTLEVLISLPITEMEIVIGKWAATLVFSLFALLLTLSVPIGMIYLGNPTLMEIIVSYIGVGFLLALFISISVFFSVLTTNQVVAFLLAVLSLFLLNVSAGDFAASLLPQQIREWLIFLTPLYHFSSFTKGIIDIRALFYFVSTSIVFIFLTTVMLEKRD